MRCPSDGAYFSIRVKTSAWGNNLWVQSPNSQHTQLTHLFGLTGLGLGGAKPSPLYLTILAQPVLTDPLAIEYAQAPSWPAVRCLYDLWLAHHLAASPTAPLPSYEWVVPIVGCVVVTSCRNIRTHGSTSSRHENVLISYSHLR